MADIRARRDLTQTELAAETGLSRAYLAQIESGRTNRLLEHLLRILRRSGATVTITLGTDAVTRSEPPGIDDIARSSPPGTDDGET